MSWVEDAGEEFGGLDMTALNTDEAYVRFNTSRDIWLYSLSDDCYLCSSKRLTNITADKPFSLALNTAHPSLLRITSEDVGPSQAMSNTTNVLCDIQTSMGEFGVYDLKVSNTNCTFKTAKEPVNIYLPIIIVLLALLGLYIVSKLWNFSMRKIKERSADEEKTSKESVPTKKRVKSLDTFRGMSIVVMIFVNDGGGRYWWMEHATWNGLTVGDLVFPFFLWIMGVCIPISIKSTLSKPIPKYVSVLQILKRSCKLFLIGIALGSIFTPYIQDLRIFGVLQRFGISYFVVATLVLLVTKKQNSESKGKIHEMFKDILDLGIEWIVMILLIVLHLLIVFLVPAPGCPTGYTGPGGLHEDSLYEKCIGGITKHIDVVILGESHLYQNPTAKYVYNSNSFDPEGIFGCILSIVHVFFGVQAGYTLLHYKKWKPVIIRWLIWAAVTGLVGGLLCGFSKEDGVIPVNKNLWSLSFVLVTSSFAFLLLSTFYLLIDVLEWWDGSPFLQPGMNAIAMYVGHSMCFSIFPFHWGYRGMRTHLLYTLEALWGTMLWILVAYIMARKKIFITV